MTDIGGQNDRFTGTAIKLTVADEQRFIAGKTVRQDVIILDVPVTVVILHDDAEQMRDGDALQVGHNGALK